MEKFRVGSQDERCHYLNYEWQWVRMRMRIPPPPPSSYFSAQMFTDDLHALTPPLYFLHAAGIFSMYCGTVRIQEICI
jgi:hypothetical protein